MKISIKIAIINYLSKNRVCKSVITFFFSLFFVMPFVAQQNSLENFSITEGLPSVSINEIIQDEIGYLWLATNKGLVQFDGNRFKNYPLDSASKVNIFFIKKDTLLIAKENGFFIQSNKKTAYLGKEKITKIVSIHENVFLGTTEGIYQLKNDYLQPLQINTQLDFSIINDIVFDGKSIYVASNKGLWKLRSFQKNIHNKKIISENCASLLLHNQKIIVSTLKNGVKTIENDTISSTISKSKNVQNSTLIDDEIWISTLGNGIEVLDAKNYSFLRRINKYNTLETNNIHTIFKDRQQNIWIATLDKGLYKLTSKTAQSSKNKPTVAIENIAVNYKNLDSISANTYRKVLELNPNQNNISFTFKTVDLNQPNKIQYRYKLTDKFTPWNSNNSVDFGNLNSGYYTFTTQARNNNFIESELRTFSFFIATPMYQKTWFLILIFSLIFAVLAGCVEYYIRKIKKKNTEKIAQLQLEKHLLSLEQKALQLQMNPHFIFNVLNGIKALGNNGNTKELNKTIAQFSVLLRSVLNNSRLEEISLQDEITTLQNYLDLEQKMSSKSFEYSFNTQLNNIDAEEILIPPMLIQPFIENAIKHGFQSTTKNAKITIDFKVAHHFLECIILDNGIGIHQSKKEKKNHTSVALKITKERIENLSKKGSFNIEEMKANNKVTGTKIWFKIPLKTDY